MREAQNGLCDHKLQKNIFLKQRTMRSRDFFRGVPPQRRTPPGFCTIKSIAHRSSAGHTGERVRAWTGAFSALTRLSTRIASDGRGDTGADAPVPRRQMAAMSYLLQSKSPVVAAMHLSSQSHSASEVWVSWKSCKCSRW